MFAYIMFYCSRKLSHQVTRYDLYSTLHFASGYVANRRNRLAITPHRASPATKCNALYNSFNCGF
jgi:hypothetical protein